MIKKYYAVLIQTDANTGYGPKVGWDECFRDRAAAEESCSRAVAQFLDAKVVEMTEAEAIENGWIEAASA